MKLSKIEKRIPQILRNPKDVIQNGREYAPRSNRARSTCGQENKAWALYKKHPSRVSWVDDDLFMDRYIALLKLATPAGNTFWSRAIVHLRQTRLAQPNYMSGRKKLGRRNERSSAVMQGSRYYQRDKTRWRTLYWTVREIV